MFDPVDPKQSFPDLEKGMLKYWREEDTFKRSIHNRGATEGDPIGGSKDERDSFSFYDGPPFATGLPHYGHLLAGTIKDVIPRYQTMRGKKVIRRFGWDCHGLPVEYEIEKEHNIGSKREIEEMGVSAFNALCRSAVQRYTKEWRASVERMGRWVDMDWDYRTMDPDYMESIWWVFKQLSDKGLLYEGKKAMQICPRCETPLANFEVTQGYKDIYDTAVTWKFKLDGEERPTYALAWTTTPWSTLSTMGLSIKPDGTYVRLRGKEDDVIVIKDRAADVMKGIEEYEIAEEFPGTTLVGKSYQPIDPSYRTLRDVKDNKNAYHIFAADYVDASEGTGLVTINGSYGEIDMEAAKKNGLPIVMDVNMAGHFTDAAGPYAGMYVEDAEKKLIQDMKERGLVWRVETITHSYPHCWRCDTPLLNYATSSWFVSVEKIKGAMLAVNAETEWVPAHIRDGRFGKWLEGARDWAISRNRYWGTPLPLWKNESTGDIEVLGSRDDLMARAPQRFTKITVLRHGESDGNLTPIYQGIPPGTDLTARGKKQAKETGKILEGRNVTAIYASPLARTEQTAKAIAKATGATITVDKRLREVTFGEYEGKHVDFSDLAFVKARRAHKLESNKVESIYHFDGMETWNEVSARVTDLLKEILPKHRGQHIVIVTHADPLLSIKHFFTQEDPAKLTHQPYPSFADPHTFYWDHERNAQMDLHKENTDGISWASNDGPSADVTFVRHGETAWNKEGKLQGQADVPLNEAGKKQSLEAAKKLHGQHFDAIVTSDLSRAVETAEIIAHELGLAAPEQWELLRERNQGKWEGRPCEEVRKQFNLSETQSLNSHPGLPPDGESLSQFLDRGTRVVRRLHERFHGKRVLIVTHAGVVGAIRVAEENLTVDQAFQRLGNAVAYTLALKPRFTRIPDVLDCWFESGSMPYAQSHFPFEPEHQVKKHGETFPPGFPADFIAEGLDQTRGWFYTLTVLSAALFDRPAFRHCIVNGIVLAEDGKKMSKRLKNYPEPLAVVEKFGADALRFALMSSPAVRGEDLRFSEKTVEETLRAVLLPLWNAYVFFVTYANAAKWEPKETRTTSPHPLDRWIRAEMQDLTNRMTEQLERYDLSATCAELADSVDALTNWYVRLSRRRFAGKGSIHERDDETAMTEEDRDHALSTLYDVLLTLSQLLAPFCPFITEAMYLNLVADDHGSVHLTDWPEAKELTKTERELLRKTRLLRTIVSLGLKVRADRQVKLRQPLAKATVALPKDLQREELTDDEIRLLREELNVKEIDVVSDPGSLATPIAQVDARKVGPRLGKKVQELIVAGKKGDFTQEKNGTVVIHGETLAADEAKVVYVGKEGADVAADRGIVIGIDTVVTPELELEGCGRDLIRAVQKQRKEAGLSVTDRIKLQVDGAPEILKFCGTMIAEETNATLGTANGESFEAELNGKKVTFQFEKS
jgi:isoleucyl-tRNA synthetase/bisphosphoglycerate-dependent phosphoglycerate mutase